MGIKYFLSDAGRQEKNDRENYAKNPSRRNVLLWYKADALTGLNDGDLVTTWPNSSPDAPAGETDLTATENGKGLIYHQYSNSNVKLLVNFKTGDYENNNPNSGIGFNVSSIYGLPVFVDQLRGTTVTTDVNTNSINGLTKSMSVDGAVGSYTLYHDWKGDFSFGFDNKPFCVEGWFGFNDVENEGALFHVGAPYGIRVSLTSIGQLRLHIDSGEPLTDSGTFVDTTMETALVSEQWYHIAVIRQSSSNVVKLYVDGVEVASLTGWTTYEPEVPANYVPGGKIVILGNMQQPGSPGTSTWEVPSGMNILQSMNGYIGEFRVVIDNAVYADTGSGFTRPAEQLSPYGFGGTGAPSVATNKAHNENRLCNLQFTNSTWWQENFPFDDEDNFTIYAVVKRKQTSDYVEDQYYWGDGTFNANSDMLSLTDNYFQTIRSEGSEVWKRTDGEYPSIDSSSLRYFGLLTSRDQVRIAWNKEKSSQIVSEKACVYSISATGNTKLDDISTRLNDLLASGAARVGIDELPLNDDWYEPTLLKDHYGNRTWNSDFLRLQTYNSYSLYEFIVYHEKHNDAKKAEIANYFAQKYGMSLIDNNDRPVLVQKDGSGNIVSETALTGSRLYYETEDLGKGGECVLQLHELLDPSATSIGFALPQSSTGSWSYHKMEPKRRSREIDAGWNPTTFDDASKFRISHERNLLDHFVEIDENACGSIRFIENASGVGFTVLYARKAPEVNLEETHSGEDVRLSCLFAQSNKVIIGNHYGSYPGRQDWTINSLGIAGNDNDGYASGLLVSNSDLLKSKRHPTFVSGSNTTSANTGERWVPKFNDSTAFAPVFAERFSNNSGVILGIRTQNETDGYYKIGEGAVIYAVNSAGIIDSSPLNIIEDDAAGDGDPITFSWADEYPGRGLNQCIRADGSVVLGFYYLSIADAVWKFGVYIINSDYTFSKVHDEVTVGDFYSNKHLITLGSDGMKIILTAQTQQYDEIVIKEIDPEAGTVLDFLSLSDAQSLNVTIPREYYWDGGILDVVQRNDNSVVVLCNGSGDIKVYVVRPDPMGEGGPPTADSFVVSDMHANPALRLLKHHDSVSNTDSIYFVARGNNTVNDATHGDMYHMFLHSIDLNGDASTLVVEDIHDSVATNDNSLSANIVQDTAGCFATTMGKDGHIFVVNVSSNHLDTDPNDLTHGDTVITTIIPTSVMTTERTKISYHQASNSSIDFVGERSSNSITGIKIVDDSVFVFYNREKFIRVGPTTSGGGIFNYDNVEQFYYTTQANMSNGYGGWQSNAGYTFDIRTNPNGITRLIW